MSARRETATDRGAQRSASRSSPLTIVSAAVAGDDLYAAAEAAARALGHGVAIALPRLGPPVVSPASSGAAGELRELDAYVTASLAGETRGLPAGLAEAIPIRLGDEVVGVVAALGPRRICAEHRAWLEAVAAAAAVTVLMRGAGGDPQASARVLLQALDGDAPADVAGIVAQARHLGVELGSGAVAVAAWWGGDRPGARGDRPGARGDRPGARGDRPGARGDRPGVPGDVPAVPGVLLAEMADGRVLGLLPAHPGNGAESALAALVAELNALGMTVAQSAPRHEPALLPEALREADLLLELDGDADSCLAGQEETYRLLIGVLLRNPSELEQLRATTISPLEGYDAEHDADLVATLEAFLAHHGSTTEAAEAMQLHRHTVGYRLTRVYEVSGHSPYETDGRERLSLGLKAHHILKASLRRERRE